MLATLNLPQRRSIDINSARSRSHHAPFVYLHSSHACSLREDFFHPDRRILPLFSTRQSNDHCFGWHAVDLSSQIAGKASTAEQLINLHVCYWRRRLFVCYLKFLRTALSMWLLTATESGPS